MGCISVSVVELGGAGLATNRGTQSTSKDNQNKTVFWSILNCSRSVKEENILIEKTGKIEKNGDRQKSIFHVIFSFLLIPDAPSN